MASIKVKQDDLRRLMKERRENAKVQLGKIDSPFAKYNKVGQLFCSICNVNVKNNSLWGSHVAGKVHKENLTKQKKGSTEKDLRNIVNIGVKRKSEEEVSKRLKIADTKSSEDKHSSKPTKASLLAGYSSSDESDDNSNHESEKNDSQTTLSNTLPPDFLDSSVTNLTTSSSSKSHTEVENSTMPNNSETLPEGFFDDPVLDAKARNIEYKDPVEEEWEKFQKTIAEEDNVSKTIIEEDLEESILERDIDQIDEQIQQWERVKNLQSLAEDVVQKAPLKDTAGGDSGNTDEELEDDDLLDWRSKGVKRL